MLKCFFLTKMKITWKNVIAGMYVVCVRMSGTFITNEPKMGSISGPTPGQKPTFANNFECGLV